MGLFKEAIQLALHNKLVDLAKYYANKSTNFEIKKKLWL